MNVVPKPAVLLTAFLILLASNPAFAALLRAEVVSIGGTEISDAVPYDPLLFTAKLCGTIDGANLRDLGAAQLWRMDAASGKIIAQKVELHARGQDGYDFCSRFLDIAPQPRGEHHVFSVDYKFMFEKLSAPFSLVLDVNKLREHPVGRDTSQIDPEKLAHLKAHGDILPDPRLTLPAAAEKPAQ